MSTKISDKKKGQPAPPDFPMERQNYLLMGLGLLIIIIGFILMMGGPEDIYSFRKITLAPLVILGGFIFEIYAIMKRPKE